MAGSSTGKGLKGAVAEASVGMTPSTQQLVSAATLSPSWQTLSDMLL
jgi:hypothetical protein